MAPTWCCECQNGSQAQAPLTRLSAEDQQYLAAWQKKQPINTAMPSEVGVETSQVKAEVVSEDPAAEKYVYRTQHFEFESQGKFNQELLRNVARDFEATYELLKALPWHVEPRPASGDHFRAKLFKTKEAYFAAGALQNSGGVYMANRQMFMVPFESIGVKLLGKSYAKDENFETHTMVHELTHEMMHFWLGFPPPMGHRRHRGIHRDAAAPHRPLSRLRREEWSARLSGFPQEKDAQRGARALPARGAFPDYEREMG